MHVSVRLMVCLLASWSMASLAEDGAKVDGGMAGMEISELIQRFAKRTQRQFVIDPRVRGQVPLAGIDVGQITYDQFLAILDVHQLALVDAGGVLAVVPDANARQFPTPVYSDLNFKAADFETVTLVVTPKKVCAATLVPVLRPLQQQAAHLAAEPQSNSLIISDHAVNARRIAELVRQIDQRGTGARDCAMPFATSAPAQAPAPAPVTPAAKPGS
jgi:general secretion pathway protein D